MLCIAEPLMLSSNTSVDTTNRKKRARLGHDHCKRITEKMIGRKENVINFRVSYSNRGCRRLSEHKKSIILAALYSKYMSWNSNGFYCSTKLHVHVDEYIVGKNANERSKINTSGIHTEWKSNVWSVEKAFHWPWTWGKRKLTHEKKKKLWKTKKTTGFPALPISQDGWR